jgi:MoaA/NifB/PqqE/SkfB family radical SAM enzyme
MDLNSGLSDPAAASVRYHLRPPFKNDGGHAWIAAVPWKIAFEIVRSGGAPATCLYEDGVRLLHAYAPHEAIRSSGKGLYANSGRKIWFSPSDNSDPNTNGRRYEVDLSLDLATWKQALLSALTELWDLHPEAAFFRAQGGDEIPPPLFANLGLTNKCNLRCEICGSQKHLDATGVPRRHMGIDCVEAVAATIFPFIAEVELNSQGDPLLHPQIDRVLQLIGQHRCDFKVQTNGTLFTERVTELLCDQSGTIMLSLDAVGPRFDEVRRGGVWARAQPGLSRLLRRRDPTRQKVGIYPTVTRRTIGDALGIVEWAQEHDVDEVVFHRYIPIANSFEEEPSTAELRSLSEQLSRWAAKHDGPLTIKLDGQLLSRPKPSRHTVHADPIKQRFASMISAMMAPMDEREPTADPAAICVAPDHYVEIGLEGQIASCCRAQDVTLGFATSTQSFAQAWFGPNYRRIRDSLRRGASGDFPLPNCESCIATFAPMSSRGRRAVDYETTAAGAEGLDYSDWDELPIEVIQKENGHCHIAVMPPGAPLAQYALFEDGSALPLPDAEHEEIRQRGAGRYSCWGRFVYFSTSDNSDARNNGRKYALRRSGLGAAA